MYFIKFIRSRKTSLGSESTPFLSMKLNFDIHQDKNITFFLSVISIEVLIYTSDCLNFDMHYTNINYVCYTVLDSKKRIISAANITRKGLAR